MRQLRDQSDLAGIADPQVRALVDQRFTELGEYEGFSLDELGAFWLVEEGDTLSSIEAVSGCPVGTSLFTDASFGHPDFAPSWEVFEEHPTCWELAWVFNDAGYGAVLIVPKQAGIDPQVLDLCQSYSSPEPASP